MSIKDIDPGTIFGGTWVSWGVGRVPVGVNKSDSDFNTPEKTAGTKSVTLIASQMPSHTHSITDKFNVSGTSATAQAYCLGVTTNTGNLVTGSAGGGQPHTNLQPYITCYMWKRTA